MVHGHLGCVGLRPVLNPSIILIAKHFIQIVDDLVYHRDIKSGVDSSLVGNDPSRTMNRYRRSKGKLWGVGHFPRSIVCTLLVPNDIILNVGKAKELKLSLIPKGTFRPVVAAVLPRKGDPPFFLVVSETCDLSLSMWE